jgi:predicted ribosome quality control (RQC) complex YloA/Tae2 family protein
MKKAMSNVDVAAMTGELKDRLSGGFVGKAYQQSADRIWLTVQAPEGRLDLFMQAGSRIHLTRKERPASKTPPQFPAMLRSHLSGGRIAEIQQYDFDRVLELTVDRGGGRSYLIVELFPKGSMILLDENKTILTMLRKMVFRGRRMAAGEEYIYHPGMPDPRTVSLSDLTLLLSSSSTDLVRTLVRGLNMGGTHGEEVCLCAGVDKSKVARDLDSHQVQKVYEALKEVFIESTFDPHIVFKEGQPWDVLPRPLHIYQGLEIQRFASFSEAVEAFFAEDEAQPEKSPLTRRIEMQKRAVEDFSALEKEMKQKGELVYQHYGEIGALIDVIADARARGFSYGQIWEKIRSSGLPQAQVLRSLDGLGEMKVLLKGGEELDLNAGLSVPQNAQRYYEKAKEMTRKAAGAEAALQATEMLRTGKAQPQKTRAPPFRRRKPKWFERFRWFHSPDGFLVIGGRDAETNEEIYAKYLERRDLALHTDAPGAPLTVIKTEGLEVPETTLQEAAQFAVSYSSIWKAGLGSADCYLVKGDQVTKTPEHGEFLRKGAFVIRGERRYFRDVPLGLALGLSDGVLIGGPVSAVRPKADPAVEIEPGELNTSDLAKRIYRYFMTKVEDRSALKAAASPDSIVQFLPPGGSQVKGMKEE